MIRLNMIVEGQTEEAFSNRVLVPHLSNYGIYPAVQLIAKKRSSNSRSFKGGWLSYESVRSHLLRWCKSDSSQSAWFTTMLDLYALPADFPGFGEASTIANPRQRVAFLEESFRADLEKEGIRRFVPYLQLHEFEALILADPQYLDWEFLDHTNSINRLIEMVSKYGSPEDINQGRLSAPSKRIIQEIPEYESRKVSAGPIVAEKIGLEVLRGRCLHFDDWLKALEALQ